MFYKGEPDLSRARGAKAQRRREQYQAVENTIDFHQAAKLPKRPVDLIPKTRGQERLVMSLLDTNTDITVAVGPAGTGKTYLVMQAAVRALRSRAVDRLILTRPAVSVEDERHGFLPGDLISKMEPWTRPLLDVLREYYHPREITRMLDEQVIEISPLAYMRGRTFKSSWIVADEMQNATPAQMKMLLSRIGQGSRIAITGDVEQADRQTDENGLRDLCCRLHDHPVVGIDLVMLSSKDTQRHALINQILDLYQT
jgi:phosphate starvation-inducible PhoH-like protein